MSKRAVVTIEDVEYEFDVNGVDDYRVGPHTVSIRGSLTINGDTLVGIVTGKTSVRWMTLPNLGRYSVCSRTGTLYMPEPRPLTGHDPIATYMAGHHVCFHVAFWETLESTIEEDELWFRIYGDSYSCKESAVCTNRPPGPASWGKGYGGRAFRIRMLDTGQELLIDDLWHQGHMPDWYATHHPDNAEFVQ